jgi:chorismate mutase
MRLDQKYKLEGRRIEMKKILIICMAIFFCAAVASADPVEQGLPETAGEQVINSTKQMLNQGFNTENVINMTRQMLANNFKQQQILQAHAILMNARQQGLQTEPIMNKAQEGLAKQVQARAVVKAMGKVLSRHEFAAKQVKAFTKDRAKMNQMETILAGSLAAGMNHEDAERIMQVLRERTGNMTRAHAEDLAMQTFMATQMMMRLEMQSKSVRDSVCQALQQGYNAQEMNRMRNTIMANARGQNSDFGQHGGQSAMGGMGYPGGDSGDGMGDGTGGGGMDGGHM